MLAFKEDRVGLELPAHNCQIHLTLCFISLLVIVWLVSIILLEVGLIKKR
jgi:hypothetical protein